MRDRIRRDEQFKPKNPFHQLGIDILVPFPCAIRFDNRLADVIQYRQQETPSSRRRIQDERIVIGKTRQDLFNSVLRRLSTDLTIYEITCGGV